jgi:hypothetical protein
MTWLNPRTNPPPVGEIVEVTGSDFRGDWIIKLKRKNYKKKPSNTRRFYKDGDTYWRWVYTKGLFEGTSIDEKDVPEKWRKIIA